MDHTEKDVKEEWLGNVREMRARRLFRISESSTLSLVEKVRSLRESGRDVIDLGAGEPDFDTFPAIRQAALEAMEKGYTRYSPVQGYGELRKAVCEFYNRKFSLPYNPNQIVVTCGAKQALFNLFLSCLNPADEVIVIAPYWVSYPQQIELAGGKVRLIHSKEKEHFRVNLEQLEEAIGPKTKFLVLNSPSNPTGIAYDRETLEMIASLLQEHPNIMVVSDDVYAGLVYENFPLSHIGAISPDIFERTISIYALSKTYAMTGWRIGFAAGPEEMIRSLVTVQSQTTSGANSIAQMAGIQALRECEKDVKSMVSEFAKRRKKGFEVLSAIEGISCELGEGAFYFFPNVARFYGSPWKGGEIRGSADFARFLLEEGVAVVPGEAFGADEHIRISFATQTSTLLKGISRIHEATKKLRK